MSANLAVYTVVHPGVKAFIADWYESIVKQTDSDFDLWISLDSLDKADVTDWIGRKPRAEWLPAEPGNTPAEIRSNAIQHLIGKYSAIVFVDSDDVLRESRVAAARAALETNDLVGCALRLVDEQGQDLGLTFELSAETRPEDVLPQNNVFGLSNSAYRSELLGRCLPVPSEVVLVDWFLATKAWLMGASLTFDPVIQMDYRQYGANTARVRFPVAGEQVVKDTELVRRHFMFLLNAGGNFLPERQARLKKVAARVERFHDYIVQNPHQLQHYVETLNILNPTPLWWSAVAHPALESIWRETTQISYERC